MQESSTGNQNELEDNGMEDVKIESYVILRITYIQPTNN